MRGDIVFVKPRIIVVTTTSQLPYVRKSRRLQVFEAHGCVHKLPRNCSFRSVEKILNIEIVNRVFKLSQFIDMLHDIVMRLEEVVKTSEGDVIPAGYRKRYVKRLITVLRRLHRELTTCRHEFTPRRVHNRAQQKDVHIFNKITHYRVCNKYLKCWFEYAKPLRSDKILYDDVVDYTYYNDRDTLGVLVAEFANRRIWVCYDCEYDEYDRKIVCRCVSFRDRETMLSNLLNVIPEEWHRRVIEALARANLIPEELTVLL